MKMNGRLVTTLFGSVLGVILMAGCFSHTREVVERPVPVATDSPPPPHDENPGPAPAAGAVWVHGYYERQGGEWVWVPGHWQQQ